MIAVETQQARLRRVQTGLSPDIETFGRFLQNEERPAGFSIDPTLSPSFF
jgi:hypothetical protein